MRAFTNPPTVIPAIDDRIDLFVATEPDVGHEEATFAGGLPRQSPWVPEAIGVDLGPAATGDERVVIGDGVRRVPIAVDVDPEDLAVELRRVLGVALGRVAGIGVASASAVAGSEVEEPVRSEAERAAAVVGLGLVEGEDHALRVGIDRVRIQADRELAQPVGVVHGWLGIRRRPASSSRRRAGRCWRTRGETRGRGGRVRRIRCRAARGDRQDRGRVSDCVRRRGGCGPCRFVRGRTCDRGPLEPSPARSVCSGR